MLRKVAASYWTAAALGLVTVVVHAIWWVKSDHTGEVISGSGAALVVLGIFVAARPYIRAGVEGLARQQVQAPQFTPLLDAKGEILRAARVAYLQKVQAAIPDVIAERVVAVVVILIGTLLNGYGTPIARVLGWKV